MSSVDYKGKYDEYHNKFWSLHHTNKDLLKEINDLKRKLDVYERNIIHGKIKTISYHHDYGLITHSDYGDIFFHKSKCNFQLTSALLGNKVTFNLTISRKLEAHNVGLKMEDLSALDILDFGIYLHPDPDPDPDPDPEPDPEPEPEPDPEPDPDPDPKPTNLDMINLASDIWYMNHQYQDHLLGEWLNCRNNGFVTSWNKGGRNNSLKTRLKKNDIIAWYTVGRGYSAILKVNGECRDMTEEDLRILKGRDKVKVKEHREWEKTTGCEIIIIPVDIISHCDMNKCIKRLPNWTKEEWTSGFRGSCAMKPKNKKWKEQVITIYKEMVT